MFKKIIFALLEFVTIGCGTYVFVSTMVNEDYIDNESAGMGAFLIVLGFLLQNWRTTLFVKEAKIENDKASSESRNRIISTLFIIGLSMTLFALNRKINAINSNSDYLESEIDSKFDDTGNRLENVESFEERIENLESVSHIHYH